MCYLTFPSTILLLQHRICWFVQTSVKSNDMCELANFWEVFVAAGYTGTLWSMIPEQICGDQVERNKKQWRDWQWFFHLCWDQSHFFFNKILLFLSRKIDSINRQQARCIPNFCRRPHVEKVYNQSMSLLIAGFFWVHTHSSSRLQS